MEKSENTPRKRTQDKGILSVLMILEPDTLCKTKFSTEMFFEMPVLGRQQMLDLLFKTCVFTFFVQNEQLSQFCEGDLEFHLLQSAHFGVFSRF